MTALEEIKKALEGDMSTGLTAIDRLRFIVGGVPDFDPITVEDADWIIAALESLQRENEELREDRDRTARNRDMYKGQVERQAAQIEDFRSETKRLQVGVYVETLPAVHLIRVFADDMNERNWDDKRAYIKQQADRIRAALASTGGEHHAE